MKAYTDIEQSKKLAEILPIGSANMFYDQYGVIRIGNPKERYSDYHQLPVWSLAALLDIIPKRIKDFNVLRIDIGEKDFAIWYDEIGYGVNTELPDITMKDPVDACYEMIIKLHEQKLL